MRIAFEATAAVRQYAGVGRFARGLLAGLRAIDAHNQYTLLTIGKPVLPLAPEVVPVQSSRLSLPIPDRLATVLWHRWHCAASPALLCRGADLFVTPDYALLPVGRMPAVVTIHDLSFITHPECADSGLRRYLEAVVPRSVAQAATVFAVSHTTAADLQHLLSVPAEKIVVVPNGVDRFFVRPPLLASDLESEMRLRFNLTPGYLLAVGTLEPRKNYVRLLQAFAALRRSAFVRSLHASGSTPPLTLVIAGREGWLFEPIFREVARLGLGEAVRFISRFDDNDLRLLYAGARLFVYPSLYEGFGIPPLEALAAGTAVVASRAGAIPEVLGDSALYFNPLNVEEIVSAMTASLQDRASAELRIAAGRGRVGHYTWEAAAQSALLAFQRLAAA